MRPLPFAFALVLATTAAAARAQEAMSRETVTRVKDATTYLRTDVDSEEGESTMSGSGFVLKTDGTTGYIVTNAHVIVPSGRDNVLGRRPATRVYFRSGTKAETRAMAEVVALDPGRDLALLRVANVEKLPA